MRAARAAAAVDPEAIAGLAFDATCSLVLRDAGDRPLTASLAGEPRHDTILWLDHRATPEAEALTATGHPTVAFSGGAVSPEMQLPKLLWLKHHLPATWSRLARALDLADYLSWRATGNAARSRCTLTCKWNYLPQAAPAWPLDFLAAADLADAIDRAGLPASAAPVGTDLGALTEQAARDLGLTTRTRVAAGMIDAHAGALGVLGDRAGAPDIARHAALIGGTSACLMTFAAAPRPIAGIWGPYLDGALPGLWLSEGGLSAAGALLDHLLRRHGHDPAPATHARVIARVAELRAAEPHLAADLHVIPDLLGRRSPDPDPHARGSITGPPLDASFDALCRLYWRACLGIALGLRAVLDHLRMNGVAIETLHVTGGHARNPLMMELYPDATGCRTIEPGAPDGVLLGSAMVAAAAAGLHPSLAAAAAAMHQPGIARDPDPAMPYERDREVFRLLRRGETAGLPEGTRSELL